MKKLRNATVVVIQRLIQTAAAWGATGPKAGEVNNFRSFYDHHWPSFGEAFTTLLRDPAVSNRSHQELNSELSALVEEILRDPSLGSNISSSQAQAREFATRAIRELQDFEVAFAIEALALPTGTIHIGRTTFVHFDRRRARAWGLPPGGGGLSGELIGRTVGIVQVKSGSFDRARELAALEVDTSLALLRTAFATSSMLGPMDELFLQRRSPWYIAKSLASPPTFKPSFHRIFSSVTLDLRRSLKDAAPEFTKRAGDMGVRVAPLFDGSVPQKLCAALLRGAEWIGSSITRESFDDKVVDLSAAMESMLSSKSDSRKGEAIALRYVLLTQRVRTHSPLPYAMLPIYESRSDIVHGSRRHVAGELEYRALREVAIGTFDMLLELIKNEPSLRTVYAVINLLESDADEMERTAEMFFSASSGSAGIVEYANLRAGQLRAAAPAT